VWSYSTTPALAERFLLVFSEGRLKHHKETGATYVLSQQRASAGKFPPDAAHDHD